MRHMHQRLSAEEQRKVNRLLNRPAVYDPQLALPRCGFIKTCSDRIPLC